VIVSAGTEKPRTLDPADGYEVATSNIITSMGDRLYSIKKPRTTATTCQELPKVSGLTYTIPA